MNNNLHERAHIQETPFQSNAPIIGGLIARFRAGWNNVAARWYVQGHFQQQSAFNHLVANEVTALDERVRQQDADIVVLTKTVAELEAQVKQLTHRVQQLESPQ